MVAVIYRGPCHRSCSTDIPVVTHSASCLVRPSLLLPSKSCGGIAQGSPSGATPPQQPPPRQSTGPGGPQHAPPAGGVQVLLTAPSNPHRGRTHTRYLGLGLRHSRAADFSQSGRLRQLAINWLLGFKLADVVSEAIVLHLVHRAAAPQRRPLVWGHAACVRNAPTFRSVSATGRGTYGGNPARPAAAPAPAAPATGPAAAAAAAAAAGDGPARQQRQQRHERREQRREPPEWWRGSAKRKPGRRRRPAGAAASQQRPRALPSAAAAHGAAGELRSSMSARTLPVIVQAGRISVEAWYFDHRGSGHMLACSIGDAMSCCSAESST